MSPTTFLSSSVDAFTRRRTHAPLIRRDRRPKPELSVGRLLREHAWGHRYSLLLAVFLNSIPGLGVALQTLAPKYLIDSVFAEGSLSPDARVFRLCALLAIYLASAFIFRMAAWYGSYKVWTRIREQVVMELRAKFFQHINNLCLRFHGRHTSGELFTYVMGSPLG